MINRASRRAARKGLKRRQKPKEFHVVGTNHQRKLTRAMLREMEKANNGNE